MRTSAHDPASTSDHRARRPRSRLLRAPVAMLATAACCLGTAGPAAAASGQAAAPARVAAPARAAPTPGSPLTTRTTPHAGPRSSFLVRNHNSGKCLGTAGGLGNVDAVQWACGTSPGNQRWHWGRPVGDYPGWYQLVNSDGDCLGISAGSTREGANAIGWGCLGSKHLDQYWAPLGYSCGGDMPLENLKSGYVLGVSGNSKMNGAHVVQWMFRDQCDNQFWSGI